MNGAPASRLSVSGRPSTSDRGRAGEQAAAAWLVQERWLVRDRNFRAPGGEIDIVAERDGTLAFFEVKSWAALPAAELEHSINARKQGRIARAARVWLHRHPALRRLRPRFDVIFVSPGEPRFLHIVDAFTGEVD
jgi:putative endonuclease